MPHQLDSPPIVTKPRDLTDWLLQPNLLVRLGILLIVALYARTIAFDFVYDDYSIPVSPLLQSWHGVIDAFKMDVFGTAEAAGSAYYRPMSSALCVVIARLTSVTPGWFHLGAILIAITVFLLCYLCGRLLFDDDLLAALAALLFALHPTKVETVAWIGSSTCDGQSAIYFFMVLLCYLYWWKTRKPTWVVLSAGFFAAALFTKETMIVLPLLVAIHFWLLGPRAARLRTIAVLMVPYVVADAFYAAVRHSVLRPLLKSSIAIQPIFTLVNVWSAPLALWWYIKRLLYPFGMSILYDSIVVQHPSFRNFGLPLLATLALVIALAFAWHRTRSWLVPFLAAWLVLTLGPPLALSPRVTIHDRYLQLAAYPFCALLTYALLKLVRSNQRWRNPAFIAVLAIIIFWGFGTWHESGYWRDSITLWKRAVQVAPHNINARVELARLYSEKELPEAIRVLDDGLRIVPDSPGLWRSRGLLLFNAGDFDNARASLFRALDVSSRFAADPQSEPVDVKFGRASSAFYLGEIDMLQGNPINADRWLRIAIDIQPDDLDYQRVMVANLRKQGLNEQADQQQKIVDELQRRLRPASKQ
jgi:tetratricopeptide (TPR) repeat protein